MSDVLPLTRRALAAWARYRDAGSAAERAHQAGVCQLAEPEPAALERLRANLIAAGPQSEWFTTGHRHEPRVRPETRDTLLDGLTLKYGTREGLLRALRPATMGASIALKHMLTDNDTPEAAMPQPTSPLRQAFRAALTARQIDPAAIVPADTIRALAADLNADERAVKNQLAALRAERGIRLGRGGWRHRATAAPPPPTTSHDLVAALPAPQPLPARPPDDATQSAIDAILAVLLQEGLRNVHPAALRQPLAALAATRLPLPTEPAP